MPADTLTPRAHGTLLLDVDRRVRYLDAPAADHLGIDGVQAIGLSFDQLLPGQGQQALKRWLDLADPPPLYIDRQPDASPLTLRCRALQEPRCCVVQVFLHDDDHNLTAWLDAAGVLAAIRDGILIVDGEGCIRFANAAAAALIGREPAELRGIPLKQAFPVMDEQARRMPNPLAADADVVTRRAMLPRENDAPLTIEFSASRLPATAEQRPGSVLVFRDVTPAHELAKQLDHQARHDALTGLVNRREFLRRLEQSLEDLESAEAEHVLLYMDLDGFKSINDVWGHAAGDACLQQLAGYLRSRLRAADTLARLGGDEFGVLLRDCPTERGKEIAEDLRQSILGFRFQWQNRTAQIGVSIGLITLDQGGLDADSVMVSADNACYHAKQEGRNRVVVTQAGRDLNERRNDRYWADMIRHALDGNKLVLFCQPIVPLGEPAAGKAWFEILLRLRDERGRLVSPGSFLPVAERHELALRVDQWVVGRCAAHAVLHRVHFKNSGVEPRFSINLSAASLVDPHWAGFFAGQLKRFGLPGDRFSFEFRETDLLANRMQAMGLIASLREMGAGVVLDDFGSGLSSFSQIKDLGLDWIKIDGSRIQLAAEDLLERAVVESMARVAKVMGVGTIAESLESDANLRLMRSLGLDYGQGFAIRAPMPLAKAIGWAAGDAT